MEAVGIAFRAPDIHPHIQQGMIIMTRLDLVIVILRLSGASTAVVKVELYPRTSSLRFAFLKSRTTSSVGSCDIGLISVHYFIFCVVLLPHILLKPHQNNLLPHQHYPVALL